MAASGRVREAMVLGRFSERIPAEAFEPREEGLEALINERRWIADHADLLDVVDIFHGPSGLRLLPVLDVERRPTGAIFEQDLRRILFNPFGYALLRNPSFGGNLRAHVRNCPTVEADRSVGEMLAAHADHPCESEGVIIVRDGRYLGLVTGRILLRLAADREVEQARLRAQRLGQIAAASTAFRDEAARLAGDLARLSGDLASASSVVAVGAAENERHAAMVANAVAQAAANMGEIGEKAHAVAASFQRIETRTRDGKQAAGVAVNLIAEGRAHMDALSRAADEIGQVTGLIDGIARRTAMLAMNATIEAARAGESGRGFAVVASEVKTLASQTRTAASGISERVDNIRGAIRHVTSGRSGIEQAASSVEAMTGSIFDEIREQRYGIELIAANVEEAGAAANHIGERAVDIKEAATGAADTAQRMEQLASAVARQGEAIQRRLLDFIGAVQDP